MNIIDQLGSKVSDFLGIKAFQLFHCFLGKGPRERRRKGGRRMKKKERRKKGKKEEGRGRESTMNEYSDITQHTHSSSC